MKVYNDNQYITVHPQLLDILEESRVKHLNPLVNKEDKFSPELYVQLKAELLSKYLRTCGLDTVLIAISGGVDSAVVLKIAEYTKKLENSPLKHIVAVTLPITDSVLTNQSDTVSRAEELMSQTDCESHTIDMEAIYTTNVWTAIKHFGSSNPWSDGQMGAYVRTSFLYYITAVLNGQGRKPILLGTTNRDEGSYLGYVGKASDGMVDVQLISDIYKSEVYAVAEYLNVPESILGIIPNGDMYDGRVDTEVFGAPYSMVELFNRSKAVKELEDQLNSLTGDVKEEWDTYAENLEKMHKYNNHKYVGLSPAVHLDLWSTEVVGGYINYYERTKEFLQ